MKYLKTYKMHNEGFGIISWIKNHFKEVEEELDDDTKIAKGLLEIVLPTIDPEDISTTKGSYDSINGVNVKLNKSSNLVIFKNEYGNYVLKIDEDEVSPRKKFKEKDRNNPLKYIETDYRKKILDTLIKMYKDEQARLRYQRISTNAGL